MEIPVHKYVMGKVDISLEDGRYRYLAYEAQFLSHHPKILQWNELEDRAKNNCSVACTVMYYVWGN